MARTVADAAILLGAMVGRDKQDGITSDAEKKGAKDYTKFLDPEGLKGSRLGLVLQFLPRQNTDQIKAYYQSFIEKLRDAGAEIIDVTLTPNYGSLGNDRTAVLQYEFKEDLNKYLVARGAKYKSLEDLIKFNEENKAKELGLFGQELFIESQQKAGLDSKEYLDALARIKKATREEGIDAAIAKDKLDALVAPTTGGSWSVAATAGYPYITVPLGLRENTATGIAFFGKAYSEPSLIKFAYAFEQRTKGRVTPQFLATYPKKA